MELMIIRVADKDEYSIQCLKKYIYIFLWIYIK